MNSRNDLPVATIALLLITLAGGCGTGDYERRLEARIRELRQGSEFSELGAPAEIPGTPLTVRLPQTFPQPLTEGEQGKGVDASRRKPPGITLPGPVNTYELFLDDDAGGKFAYYCYLAAYEAKGKDAKDPTRSWKQQLANDLKEPVPNWEQVAAQTADGRAVEWQRLRAIGEQSFYHVDKGGQGTAPKLRGALVLYYRQEAGYNVIIGWRVPLMIEENVQLDRWEKLVAGTLAAKP